MNSKSYLVIFQEDFYQSEDGKWERNYVSNLWRVSVHVIVYDGDNPQTPKAKHVRFISEELELKELSDNAISSFDARCVSWALSNPDILVSLTQREKKNFDIHLK